MAIDFHSLYNDYMKKLTRREWVGVVVTLLVVGFFLVFPRILASRAVPSATNAISQ